MSNSILDIEKPMNEQVPGYLPGSPERKALKDKLAEMQQTEVEIPLIINGQEVRTGKTEKCIIPHKKSHVLATYHMAGEKETSMAIEAALEAKKKWEEMPWEHRLSVFLKAAELISGPWRQTLLAATMLGQSKTVFETEAEAVCELMDFLRYNTYFARKIMEDQPRTMQGVLNRVEYRPLEGFVFAVTPFNFTAIGGNLPTSPAMLGNTVVWKPASAAIYSNYYLMRLLQAAGLPDGVINFVPGSGSSIGPVVMQHPMLAGIHFTGSTSTFNHMWSTVAGNIERYRSYPRIVGETGGKDFLFAHHSADEDSLIAAMVAGGFSYQGQKCSASSRVYLPESLWTRIKQRFLGEVKSLKVGDVTDFTTYMGAVIDQSAYESIKGYIDFAKESEAAEILAGGECDDSQGFFIQPTVIQTTDPKFKTMQEEIFGPVVTIYVYKDEDYEQALELCASTSNYALTGAIFARDREALLEMERRLRYSAGNLYVNDKTTGAFVGMQPFGGGRGSGTNEKVGSRQNIMRWVSPRTIKENFNAGTDFRFDLMQES
jgi:1-pyrroline-5-carboxylate dehydrogenase